MKASEFIKIWIGFYKQIIINNPQCLASYNLNKDWTNFILGSKRSEQNDSPLGNFITNSTELIYRKEDGLVDLALAEKGCFKGISTMESPDGTCQRGEIRLENSFYPPVYEILIEHENNVLSCWQEMVKLTYFRAKLKVLITYNWDVDHKSNYAYVFDVLVQNFKDIIQQANEKLKESDDTEYLLIIGQLDSNKSLQWHFTHLTNTSIVSYDKNQKITCA